MTPATGSKAGFTRRLNWIGKTLADARPYILAIDGDKLTCDIDHPDYPHKSKLAGLHALHRPSKRLPGPELWREIHERPLLFDPRRAVQEMLWLRDVARRLPNSCQCNPHWQTWLRRRPPALSSPAAYALWTYDAHVEVNLRLHKPGITRSLAIDLYEWAPLLAAA